MVNNLRISPSEMEQTTLSGERKITKLKYIFIFLNGIILLIAVTLACLMSSLEDYWGYYDPFLYIYSELHNFGVIFTACAVAIVAIFGFIISYTARKTHFLWYGLALILMILLDLKVLFHGLLSSGMAQKYVSDTMYSGMERYTNSSTSVISIDNTQRSLGCCGIDNQTDWYTRSSFNGIPLSCCPMYVPTTINKCDELQFNLIYDDPCFPKIIELAQLGMILMYCMVSMLICLKIMCIILSNSIYHKIE